MAYLSLFFVASLKHFIICVFKWVHWSIYSVDSELLHIHSKQLFLLQFLIIQKHDFKKSNISQDQVAFFQCKPRAHCTVRFPMQCKRKTTDLGTCEILDKFKPCLCKLYTGRQEILQGFERTYMGSRCQDSSSLNMSHHICPFGMVLWVSS